MKFNSDKDQIQVVDNDTDVIRVMRNITESGFQEDAFYVFDVNDLIKKYENWKQKLPRVIPHYAVKCNDHLLVLKILASLGVGFDCASKEEIRKIISLGIDPSRIIFANPAKPASHVRYASDQGVDMITFDNENELYKLKSLHPSAKLILRIRCDAAVVQCPLGIKYGCNIVTEAPTLLHVARNLNLDIIGISFHVGSGCGDPAAYRRAIAAARTLFKVGEDLGFNMQILDIGGGFPGNKHTSIDTIAEVINDALDEYFPVECGVNIVAEPGRYFVASAFTLATFVHSKREVKDPKSGAVTSNMYYINDGIYGSFNSLLYDHAVVTPIPLSEIRSCEILPCSIWGPTCDGLDLIAENIKFPVLNTGDWIMFENMGAYTFAAASLFNGFPVPKIYTILNEPTMLSLKDAFQPPFEEDINYEDLSQPIRINDYPLADESWNKKSHMHPSLFSEFYTLNENCTFIST